MPALYNHLAPKRTQSECCYATSLDASTAFCGTCSKPLIRCMAAEECGGLVDDQGLCTICVNPIVQIDAGAVAVARVGDAVALPVSIINASSAGRPLFVTALWSREGGTGPWREEPLEWERLGVDDTRTAKVMAREITQAGSHSVELRLAVSNHWHWRKECYVFHADFTLTIAPEKDATGPVVNIGGESAGHGNIVYISNGSEQDAITERTGEAINLTLSRVEKAERSLGFRGLESGCYVPRSAQLLWQGFPSSDVPMDGPITTLDGLLIAGRSRSKKAGGLIDIRLLAEQKDGLVDEALSVLLSRRHFEIYIERDRLMLRVASDSGVRINGDAYGRDKVIGLQDGTTIAPLVKAQDNFGITVKFQTEHNCVRKVIFARSPISQREG